MHKHGPMQPRKSQRRTRSHPRRHRPHEAPRDNPGHTEEPQVESAVLEPHHVSRHAVVDR